MGHMKAIRKVVNYLGDSKEEMSWEEAMSSQGMMKNELTVGGQIRIKINQPLFEGQKAPK